MRISDWSSDGCSSDLIHQHGRSGQNAGTGAHIDVAARINPAKAEIIDIRVPVAFGSRVREFSLYAQHGPANGDVISNSQAIEQTIDRLIIPDRKSTRLNSITNAHLVCRLLLEKNNNKTQNPTTQQHKLE